MDSWTTLLMLQMSKGKYLSTQKPTEEHWLRLWVLVSEAYPETLRVA